MKRKLFAFLIGMFLLRDINAQPDHPWQGKKCAVVLTYDDAIDQQLDNAVPVLDSLDLKATFYITAYSSSIQSRMSEWKRLSERGHELGNHPLFHPCFGGPDRSWVKPQYDLRNYTIQRMTDGIKMTNIFLQLLDGKTRRTFAFTCGDMKIGDSSFINRMKKDFIAARAVRNEMHKINEIDLYNVDWLLVILFHGIGGGNSLNVSVSAHREFLTFLKQNQKDIMIGPMLSVADYIRSSQHLN